MKPKNRMFWSGVTLLLISNVCSAEVIDRRKDQFGRDFGYYLYPIVGEIPGLGRAAGFGASVLNMNDSDSDFTGYYVRGDFQATGAALLDYHLLSKRLIFDVGYNDFLVASKSYTRGIDSDSADVIYPRAEGAYLLGQFTLTFDERRYEMFVRTMSGRNRLLGVLDKNGQSFEGVDTDWENLNLATLGGSLDLTDDRLDPRRGVRFELASHLPKNNGADESEYFVNDYNLTGYVPMRKWDTIVFNLFHSRAHVIREGLTDYAALQQRYGLELS